MKKMVVGGGVLLIALLSAFCIHKFIYMENASIWYSEKHFDHPDKINRVLIRVRGVKFYGGKFYGGSDGKENFFDKVRSAEALFHQHNLLKQVGLGDPDNIHELVVFIKRSIPGEKTMCLKIHAFKSWLRYETPYCKNIYVDYDEAGGFYQRLSRIENAVQQNENKPLHDACIDPGAGLSEFKILVKK